VLAFGEDSAPLRENRFATVQGLSGTGSLRVGGEFLSRFYPGKKLVLIPNPSWANHRNIFERCGMEVQPYRWVGFCVFVFGWEGLHQAERWRGGQSSTAGRGAMQRTASSVGVVPGWPSTPSLLLSQTCLNWCVLLLYCCRYYKPETRGLDYEVGSP
jgi:hypothetical protein